MEKQLHPSHTQLPPWLAQPPECLFPQETRAVRSQGRLCPPGPHPSIQSPNHSVFTAALARASKHLRALFAKKDFPLNLKVGCVQYFI